MKNSIKRKINFDVMLLSIVLILVVIGTAAIYSASSYIALGEDNGTSHTYLHKQLVRLALGLILMILFMQIDYHLLQKMAPVFLGIAFILLIYVLIGGDFAKGSRRAFKINGISFQPSEMAKYALILFLSTFLIDKGKKLKELSDGLLPALIVIFIVLFPIVLEPDLGTTIIIFLISMIMVFVAGASLYHLSGLAALAMAVVSMFLVSFPYQKARLIGFLNPIRGIGEPVYQIRQSLISFGNGGFFGVGLGNSRQKMHFLPHPFNDFIYSIVGEEAGLIGCVLLLLLFMAFMWRGLWIAVHAPDKKGQLLAIGITVSIVIYALFNAGIALNLLPVTGITMPFISYGGSSLIMNFIAIGVLLNISMSNKQKTFYKQTIKQSKKSNSRIRYRKIRTS